MDVGDAARVDEAVDRLEEFDGSLFVEEVLELVVGADNISTSNRP